MKRKIISAALSAAVLSSVFTAVGTAPLTASAAGIEDWTANTSGTPQFHETARQMEDLSRGLFATVVSDNGYNKVGSGVYLSWRLLGTESLTNQAFEIYRSTSENGTYSKIYTTGVHDATNYTDKSGTASNYYKVVPAGTSAAELAAVEPTQPSGTFRQARGSLVAGGTSLPNAFSYIDVPVVRPNPVPRMGDGKTSYYYTDASHTEGGQNDASVGDLDGDGDYEIVLKWNPEDSKDSAGSDFTGRVYLDGYEIDPNNGGYMWRIDLGQNITAGPHYTQFMVYDFDGDGKSEIVSLTAPGSIDGTGHYVTEVGDTDEIRKADNTASNVGTSGKPKGKNLGPEYYTIFDGETGAALCTTDAIPFNNSGYWGDSIYNRAYRYLAGVAYLDGVHPSLIECRGYYARAVIRAYSWDGESLTQQWEYNSGNSGLYSDGNHNLSIGDIDNDGYDEIVYGSASLDHDGKTILGDSNLGHGDAMHLSDFNNDGKQELFSVKEDDFKTRSDSFRVAGDKNYVELFEKKTSSSDNGRGVMDNIDDAYALKNPNALALAWCASHTGVHDLTGKDLKDSSGNEIPHPATSSRSMTNFTVYWDGDLGRELLDDNQLAKFDASTGYTTRFYDDGNGYISGASNNSTKHTPTLTADIWGDWREEIILAGGKGQNESPYLRIFTSTLPTDYRLTTLMHDAQYRCGIAWQNVAYNQPPHTSYYIGSAALAKDSSGKTMNYLAPATLFTSVTYGSGEKVPVTGISISDKSVSVEKTKSVSITASVEPANASKKGITWTSSNPAVATVTGGTITGVSNGTATITAIAKDGGYTATCEVTVWSTPVTGVKISTDSMSVGLDYSKKLTASVAPANASVQDVIWSSSDKNVATVDSEGNVYGVSLGKATITAKSTDSGATAECTVYVVSMVSEDITGDDVFVTTNTDKETVLSNATAISGTLTQTKASTGGEMHRNITKLTDGHAILNCHITTGGQRIDGENWNWDGHEYSLNIELLGEDGRNILTFTQPYATSAAALTTKIGANDPASFSSTWNPVIDKIGSVQGSAKRWVLNIEFDYDNSTANATVYGTSNQWEDGIEAQYTTSFDLNGLSLEQIRISTTKNGEGTISAAPMIEALSYTKKELGKYVAPPTPVDHAVTDFKENSRITVSQASGSENEITFTNASNANNACALSIADISSIVKDETTYSVEFDSNIADGTRARIALVDASKRPGSSNKNGYDKTGVAWVEGQVDSSSYTVNEDKTTYGSISSAFDNYIHTRLDIDTEAKTISYKITDASGATLLEGKNLAYLDDIAITGIEFFDTINSKVSKIKNVNVITYVPYVEPDPTPSPSPTPTPASEFKITKVTSRTVSYSITTSTAIENLTVIGALYDGRILKAVKIGDTYSNIVSGDSKTGEIAFDNAIGNSRVKLFAWDSTAGMNPIFPAMESGMKQEL
ncbi:MAG: Ig-like domain-containing protein [Oscillospiraceae bacterium]|nr:Ig-like domain-containing protein [Oscillospiraceae bacterium]